MAAEREKQRLNRVLREMQYNHLPSAKRLVNSVYNAMKIEETMNNGRFAQRGMTMQQAVNAKYKLKDKLHFAEKKAEHIHEQLQREIAAEQRKIATEQRKTQQKNLEQSMPFRKALNKLVVKSPYWWQAPVTPQKSAMNRLNMSTKRYR